MMPKLQRLRALSLNGYSIRKLPNAIGDLKYLQYLDLCYTDIHVLPESISSIYNLQILKLIGCHSLKKLCTDMGNLINLRYLNVSSIKRKCSAWLAGVANLAGMPLRTCMGSTSLENLSIEYCKSLMYIARNRLPSNLKRPGIGGCDNLRGLMQEENNNLPATLEVIGIHNCLKLESIAERFENHTALKTINISDCESLKSLPTGGDLPYMNLTSLHIRNYDGNLYDFINLQKLRSLITKKRTSTPLPSPSTKGTSASLLMTHTRHVRGLNN
ncbi:hypothetical protein Q3G72_007626 [Acer saccharum]|nr:hypothetical protein Q3G72_007626 [Acer saccharum]